MKRLIIALALIGATVPALAGTNISINIGQPGFYGALDLGDFRAPPVYYNEPIVIERHTRYAAEPMYLRVPPGHMKKWGKHCGQYNACGRQVYFVRDDWYNSTYAPRYREMHGGERYHQEPRHREVRREYVQVAQPYYGGREQEREHGGGRGRDKEHGHDDDDKHGGGHGHGHGHDKD